MHNRVDFGIDAADAVEMEFYEFYRRDLPAANHLRHLHGAYMEHDLNLAAPLERRGSGTRLDGASRHGFHLFGDDIELSQPGAAERSSERHIGGVAAGWEHGAA